MFIKFVATHIKKWQPPSQHSCHTHSKATTPEAMAQSTRTASGSGGGGSGSDGAPALSTTTTASTLRVTSAASPPRVERRGSVQQAPTLAPVTTTGASYGRRDAAGAGAGFHGRGEQKHKRVVIGVCGMDKKVWRGLSHTHKIPLCVQLAPWLLAHCVCVWALTHAGECTSHAKHSQAHALEALQGEPTTSAGLGYSGD